MKQKLNLASWGEISFIVEMNGCKKCGDHLENISAVGFISMGMCKKCKKFYGIVIEDITSKLLPKFKREQLK